MQKSANTNSIDLSGIKLPWVIQMHISTFLLPGPTRYTWAISLCECALSQSTVSGRFKRTYTRVQCSASIEWGLLRLAQIILLPIT